MLEDTMLSNDYRLYIENAISLVRSVTLKSIQTINAITRNLATFGYTVLEDIEYSKYHRHLRGQYFFAIRGPTGITSTDLVSLHSTIYNQWNALVDRYVTLKLGTNTFGDTSSSLQVEIELFLATYSDVTFISSITDPIIFITSLDNQEVILFEQRVLAQHPTTLGEYRLQGRFYQELLNRYPEQESFIKGVLNPITATVIEQARDFEIIQFDSTYLGQGETTLISQLQARIDNYTARYFVPGYTVSDPMYSASFLFLLFQSMVPWIINIRLENAKTPQAHEFHIWNYLAGYQELDQFRDRIYHEQALFLYRNIEYIMQNRGRSDILQFLNDNFAEPFGLLLTAYNVRQRSTNLLETKIPDVVVTRSEINDSNQVIGDTFFTPEHLIERIEDYAKLNPENIIQDTETLTERMQLIPDSDVGTGVIEVNVRDLVTSASVDLIRERFDQWFYLASRNLFPYTFAIDLPGQETTIITAIEAALLLNYATVRAMDVDDLTDESTIPIPTFRLCNILQIPAATNEELLGPLESIHYPRETTGDNLVDWIKGTIPTHTSVSTIPQFLQIVQSSAQAKVLHDYMRTYICTAGGQGQMDWFLQQFYLNDSVVIGSWSTYEEFFTETQLDIRGLDTASYLSLIETLTGEFVQTVRPGQDLPSPHYEMTEILKIISSYTVAFVAGDGNLGDTPLEWNRNYWEADAINITVCGNIISNSKIKGSVVTSFNANIELFRSFDGSILEQSNNADILPSSEFESETQHGIYANILNTSFFETGTLN